MHTFTHLCMHTYIHTFMHAYIHTYIHTYINTNIHHVAHGAQVHVSTSDNQLTDSIHVQEKKKQEDIPSDQVNIRARAHLEHSHTNRAYACVDAVRTKYTSTRFGTKYAHKGRHSRFYHTSNRYLVAQCAYQPAPMLLHTHS
jgi:hypothetical protein